MVAGFARQAGRAIFAGLGFVLIAGTVMLIDRVPAYAAAAQGDQSLEVMKGFTEQEKVESDIVKISTKRKHQIMFFMGFVLLIGIIATAGLGVAMVLFGKEVFVAHMVCAIFSVFLSIAHAVVAIVWFFPF